jgi:hypothetical protein
MGAPVWEPDPEVERWLEWAIDVIGPSDWARRRVALEGFARELDARILGQGTSDFTEPVCPADRAGWYLYQSELYLHQPRSFDMPLCSRIIPVVKRLGENLDGLKAIPFARERLRRGLVVAPGEIDSVLFELLVGQAYATRGWDEVAFVPEDPTRPTPDLHVRHHGHPVAVECKRKRAISEYARREREKWWRISAPVRRALIDRRLGIVLDYVFHVPVLTLPDDYLEQRVLPLIDLAIPGRIIDDKEITVAMRPVDLTTVQRKLRHLMMRQDGTGLYRDLFGFDHLWKGITFSLYGKPNRQTPRYMEDIRWASASIWECDAPESMRAKAHHYRRELADAVRQLPRGATCIAHIGAEAYDGEGVEAVRYKRLTDEMIAGFDADGRNLEVIYCHIFRAEVPFEENWAVEEDAHYWLRQATSVRYLLEPTGVLAPNTSTDAGQPS